MKFTEQQIRELVFENEVETDYGENGRRDRYNTTIVGYNGKFYSVEWVEGLTECQENGFCEQDAPEVKKEKETIIVEKWVLVDQS